MKSMAGATALVLMLSSSLAAYADQEIRIGVAGPFTGSYSRLGAQVWNGTNAAAKQINAAGGINGKLIVLVKAFRCNAHTEEARSTVLPQKPSAGQVLIRLAGDTQSISRPSSCHEHEPRPMNLHAHAGHRYFG